MKMKININARNRAHHFEATERERILYSGLSQGVALPYECGSGTCGTCKARLVYGDVTDNWPEAPGRKFLKTSDEYLLCQCTARSDAGFEVESFVQTMEGNTYIPASTTGRIHVTKRLTSDVMFVRIEVDHALKFDAGQFMMVEVPGVTGFRAWSMVNYQHPAKMLDFVIKKKANGGISQWLFDHERTGTELKLFGPLGRATFYPGLAQDLICIAGGSGIAGMMSILAHVEQSAYFSRHTIKVFFGLRTMEDAFFLEELSQCCSNCGTNLIVTIALSDAEVPASAPIAYPNLIFRQGLVHEIARDDMQGHYQNVRAYLAGPPPLIDASIRMLLQGKLSTANICYDKFS